MDEKVFDPEVHFIEEELINHIISMELFASKDPMFMRIFALFITRKILTQKIIKRITGLSIGKISEELNQMLEMGLISIKEVSKKGKIIYEANSASLMLIKYTRHTINKMADWEDKLIKLKSELDIKKTELEDLTGFKRIYEISQFYIRIIKKYKNALSFLDEEIKKY
jgi:hypothetical protein